MPPATAALTSLPPELILDVADCLPPDGILALKLTHSAFNNILPLMLPPTDCSLSDCARLAIRTYLVRPDPKPSHLRCILCKAVYPASLFTSSSSPACMPAPLADNSHPSEVIDLPQRLCAWHIGRLARIVHTGQGGRNEWIGHMNQMCMHCGQIQQWAACNCDCGSCSLRTVPTYTRYLNNDHECRTFLFWRHDQRDRECCIDGGRADQLWVREMCLGPDTTQQSSLIDMPVSFHRHDSHPTLAPGHDLEDMES